MQPDAKSGSRSYPAGVHLLESCVLQTVCRGDTRRRVLALRLPALKAWWEDCWVRMTVCHAESILSLPSWHCRILQSAVLQGLQTASIVPQTDVCLQLSTGKGEGKGGWRRRRR